MGLLTPLFLTGLAALALPLLIHLVRRRLEQTREFPSLMLLRDIEFKERRRRTLRDPLLLLLRCALLALLALAFARPYWSGDAAAGGGRDRLLLLDRSYSMGYGERWAAALDAARNELTGLGERDRSALLVFDEGVEIVVELGNDHAATAAALTAVEAGAAATGYAQALEQAAELLVAATAAADRSGAEIVLISDFQRSGRAADDDYRLPPAVALKTVDVAAGDAAANLAVVDANVTIPQSATPATRALDVTIQQFNGRARDASLTFSPGVAGAAAQTATLTLPASGAAPARFEINAAAATLRATLQLSTAVDGGDRLRLDDTFYSVFDAPPQLDVLVLEGAAARPRQSLFLRRALELSEAPRYRVEVKPRARLSVDDFDGLAVLVVNDAPLPAAATGERLRRFLDAGGGLLVIAGDGVQGGWPDYLPGRPGRRVDRPVTLNQLELDHPLLAALADAGPAALAAARVLRYRQLNVGDAPVLARYDNGDAALLAAATDASGRGLRAAIIGTGLDTRWNDLALTPAFVPLLHGMFAYLADYRAAAASTRVGEVIDLARAARARSGGARIAAALSGGGGAVLTTPDGASRSIDAGDALYRPQRPGFYRLRRDDEEISLAVNVAAAEADLSAFDPVAFAAALRAPTAVAAGAAAAAVDPVAASDAQRQERRDGWWRVLLLLTLALLLLETLWSNRRRGAAARRRAAAV